MVLLLYLWDLFAPSNDVALDQRPPRVAKRPPRVATVLAKRLKTVSSMSSTQFEHFVGDIMRERGYHVQVMGGSGDQGVDTIARSPENARLGIQCKRYSQPVGNKPV